MDAPKLTVLMPVYNAAGFVDDAIRSVLNQSFREYEFIIIDDGSTDDSLKIINSFASLDARIKVISRSNKGLVKTLNEGIEIASSGIVARMDADDLMAPTRLEKQYDFLRTHPTYSIVGCKLTRIDEHGELLGRDPRPIHDYGLRLFLGYGCSIGSPTMMFRKELIQKVGGFRESGWPAEDYDFLCRVVRGVPDGSMFLLPEYLYKYRENSNGISITNHRRQALKTIEVGNEYRRMMLESGWRYLTVRGYFEWMADCKTYADQHDRNVLKVKYYTTLLWFMNDDKLINARRRRTSRVLLILLTLIFNITDLRAIFNQPLAHSIPEGE